MAQMETNQENPSVKKPAGDEIILSEPQKRSVTISLMLFEKALRKADRLLSEDEKDRIFYTRKFQLNAERRQAIQEIIRQTLTDVADFSAKIGVISRTESVENEIIGDLSICWENLEENRSKRLKAYGKLDPKAAQVIDPAIDHFSRMAMQLSNMISIDLQNHKTGE